THECYFTGSLGSPVSVEFKYQLTLPRSDYNLRSLAQRVPRGMGCKYHACLRSCELPRRPQVRLLLAIWILDPRESRPAWRSGSLWAMCQNLTNSRKILVVCRTPTKLTLPPSLKKKKRGSCCGF